MRRLVTILAVVNLAFVGGVTRASAEPILDLVGTGGGASIKLATGTYGWAFSTSTSLLVDGFGLWDEASDLLNFAHDVGLWTATGTLIASATVDHTGTVVASASAEGQWLFASVTPFALAAGDYVLAAFYDLTATKDPDDPEPDFFAQNVLIATIPSVTYTGSARMVGTELTFPTVEPDQEGRFFGPNLSVQTVETVPEPATLLLLSTGLLGTYATRQRRRRP